MQELSEKYSYRALSDVIVAQASSQNIQEVLRSIVENVAREIRVKGCSIALLTPDKRLLRHMASWGLSQDYIKKGDILSDRSIAEALDGNPVQVPDATSDPRVQYPDEAAREGIASILVVPILLDDEALGVLRLYSAAPRHFNEEDIRFVSTAASMGAVTLAKAVISKYVQSDIDKFRHELLELEWGR